MFNSKGVGFGGLRSVRLEDAGQQGTCTKYSKTYNSLQNQLGNSGE